jgi:hypothetical protein
MGGRHNTSSRPQTCLIPVMPQDRNPSRCIFSFRRIPEEGSNRPHGSDDSHVSLDLLDHRIQPAAQHLLGETEGEPLDGVER